ncbi:glycosyltransferase family 39 protein [Aegicerativicinus sediminis]|uniref:glycosyltransferase family 39 protein n=1 Tax=Aegicerativicinus sediminis TaxID=2893202 RepID=UPI001E39DAAD|nr:glycosyltransferase family 39 protein [Aegicerativicinus sediminis]
MRLCVPTTLQKKILYLVIFLYPVLFIFQGGDLTDVGFFAMTYQNFFYELQLGNTNSISILSDFIGASWLTLFPNLGIIGLKFLSLIFFYFSVGLIYLILKNLTEKRLLLWLGIFCGIVFATRNSSFEFGRDEASWLFLILTSFVAIKGLTSRRKIFFYYSGILFVLACLSRFPNIGFILLFPFALIYFQVGKWKSFSIKYLWLPFKQYVLFLLGTITALMVVLLIFKSLNIYHIFLKNLDVIRNSADNASVSSYSMAHLIQSYLRESFVFLPHLLSVVFLILTTSLIYKYSTKKGNYLGLVVFVILLFCSGLFIFLDFSSRNNIKYLVPAFCAFPLTISIIRRDKFSPIVVIFSLLALTQVVGSNTGLFYKLSKGFMVLLPLSILILSETKKIELKNLCILTKPVLIIGVLYIFFFSIVTRLGSIYHVDTGITSRFRCIYPVEHKKMIGILTTKENASHIKQLSNAIENNISEGENLFIYGHQPMFYYLTKTAPPIKKFWLTNNYIQIDELFNSLEKSINSTKKYPMIVDTKQNIMGNEGQRRFEQFLKEYGYKQIENRRNFDIWKKF